MNEQKPIPAADAPAASAATSASPAAAPAGKIKVATCWLDGCSGCHMSMLDMDERLLELVPRLDVVWGPLVDAKAFPDVDVCIVEGAVATDEDLAKIKKIREHSKFLLALGDCAVTGNVPSMRNPFLLADVFARAYTENVQNKPQYPCEALPRLLDRAIPVHEVVNVDLFVPGCPPPADAIYAVLTALLDGKTPDVAALTRFGR